MVFLGGCVIPEVTVNKNVTITVDGKMCAVEQCAHFLPIWIDVEYTTKSDLETELKTAQDIKPKLDLSLPIP